MSDLNRPILGEPNAPCRSCGGPLAADQRYCLQCGARRAEARLPFLDLVAAPPVVAPAPPPVPRGPVARLSANATMVAFIGCLLLALGVGVLIGGLGGGDSSAAPAPAQVITVGGAAPVAAATTAAPAANDAAAAPPTTKPTKKRSAPPAKATKATNKSLQDLNNTKGGDYAKKSAKLPKVVGTGGKAPPKDNKPAAGGGDFQTIG